MDACGGRGSGERGGGKYRARLRRAAAAAGGDGGGAPVGGAELAVLAKMLAWPPGALFPALDLARMLALDATAAAQLAADAGPLEPSGAGVRARAQARVCCAPARSPCTPPRASGAWAGVSCR